MQAAFTSNNVTLGYNRLAVLNEPVGWWGVAVALKYGKFVNDSSAYQVWEPSDQVGCVGLVAGHVHVAESPFVCEHGRRMRS